MKSKRKLLYPQSYLSAMFRVIILIIILELPVNKNKDSYDHDFGTNFIKQVICKKTGDHMCSIFHILINEIKYSNKKNKYS